MIHSKTTKMFERFIRKWQEEFKPHQFIICREPNPKRRKAMSDKDVWVILIDGQHTSLGIRSAKYVKNWNCGDNFDENEREYFKIITQRIEECIPECSYKLVVGIGVRLV